MLGDIGKRENGKLIENAYTAALNAINGIALFSQDSLDLLNGMTDAMIHAGDWQVYYSQIMHRLKSGGYAE